MTGGETANAMAGRRAEGGDRRSRERPGPSGPMQRQVPLTRTGTRLHLPAFGEMPPTYENNARCARVSARGNSLFGDRSERLHHHQDHDGDHEDSRYLIDYTIKFLTVLIFVGGKVFHPTHKQSVHGRK